MKIATSWSTLPDTARATAEAYEKLAFHLGGSPDLIVTHSSVAYDLDCLVRKLSELSPETQIHGSTSCLGVMTEEGFHSADGRGLGLWGIRDKIGSYGVGSASKGDDPRAAAAAAVEEALTKSGRPGEIPRLVLLSSAPGHEETVLLGIQDVVGRDVPVTGGSSADNTVEGNWKQFTSDKTYTDGIVVTALFPSTSVGYAFHCGYTPTSKKGRVTRSLGRRVIREIDHRPAAVVYNDWTGGAVSHVLPDGGNVINTTTLYPIGRIVGKVGGVPYYRLSHPLSITPDGAMEVFTDVEEGDELTLMIGTTDSLVSRAGRVTQAAMESISLTPSQVNGALVTYCAGCMLTVKDEVDKVVSGIRSAFEGKPFLGTFTFGEQGCFLGGENCHGNLMISSIVFAN